MCVCVFVLTALCIYKYINIYPPSTYIHVYIHVYIYTYVYVYTYNLIYVTADGICNK